jgi:subtilisin family serine protease
MLSCVWKRPFVATEIGESDCRGTFITPLMEFLDQHGLGYLAWSWNAFGPCRPTAGAVRGLIQAGGSSAAAPQVAGVAALILNAKPGLSPAQVIEALKVTAIDVVNGHCHPRFGNVAGHGRDAASGYGLVNAAEAVSYALAKF